MMMNQYQMFSDETKKKDFLIVSRAFFQRKKKLPSTFLSKNIGLSVVQMTTSVALRKADAWK